jgi:uncharacterized protein (TIGR02594 family)
MHLLPYLFSTSALWTAASSFIAIAVGIFGLQGNFSKRTKGVLWGLSFLVAVGACLVNAQQAEDANKTKQDLLDAVNRTYNRPASLPADAPAWAVVAFKEIGQKEIPGYADNPRIVEYFRSIRGSSIYRDDIDDWASPFVEWSFQQIGKFGPQGLKPSAWLKWGKAAPVPQLGTVVVLSFSGLEHVGFYFGDEGEFIRVLGGNQDDQVCVHRYPKSAVKGYRNPV